MVALLMKPATDHDHLFLEFASALCARLCHDISSPLGTLAGTLELAAEDPQQAEEALAIAGEAASSLVNRLQLLRAAWAGDCGPMDRTRLGELASGLPHRVQVDLSGLTEGTFNGALSRIMLNLLLLGADALPTGGTVGLSGEAGTGIIVTVTGRSVVWNADLAAALANPALLVSSEARTVQMPLTIKLARAAGFRLSFLMAAAAGPHHAPRLLLAPG